MKTFTKHLLLDFGVVFGNILLSLGIFGLTGVVIYFFQEIAENELQMEHTVFLLMGALFISINILLYKAVLKKHFKPAENKNLSFYILLPVILLVIWIAVFCLAAFWHFLWMLFPAVSLIALILLAAAYYGYFRRLVGESYYVYMTSFFGVTIIPGTVLLFAMGLG